MEDLAVFKALNHSGSFRKSLVKFKKNKYVIYRLRAVRMVKNCDLEAVGRGQHFQDLDQIIFQNLMHHGQYHGGCIFLRTKKNQFNFGSKRRGG